MLHTVARAVSAAGITITPTAPPGVGAVITSFLGMVLWGVMIAAILALLIIAFIGIQSWRHNQAQQFIDKFTWWAVGCGVATAAVPITKIFFPALG